MRTAAVLFALPLVALVACTSVDTENPDVPNDANVTVDTDEPSAPVELTPALCDDTSQLQAVVDALGAGDGGSFGDINEAQLERMLADPLAPFYMVNLIQYRESAEYPDGRQTDLTGREANALYSADQPG